MNQKAKSLQSMLVHGKGKLVVCMLALSMFLHCGASKNVDNEYMQEQIKLEVNRQLSERSSAEHQQLKNSIKQNVNHELKRSGYIPAKKPMNKAHARRKHGKSDDRYLLPQLPYYSLFYNKGDFIQLLADFSIASQAYGSSGKTKDFSTLIFGTDVITVDDVLLVSKLAAENKVSTGLAPLNMAAGGVPANLYLSILADQKLVFDAWENRFGVGLNIARHYWNDDLSIGIHIPVVGKTHRLRLRNEIDPTIQANITAADARVVTAIGANAAQLAIFNADYKFSELYPDGLKEFVSTILEEKGMSFSERASTQVGLGDIDGYININIHSRHIDRFILGAHLVLPSAREADTDKLWGHDLGNGGFVQLGGFFSAMWEKSCWFNPNIHSKASYSFSSRVTRRVAKTRTTKLNTDGTVDTDAGGLNDFVLGDNLMFVPAPAGLFSLPDSTVKRFADSVTKIKIHQEN